MQWLSDPCILKHGTRIVLNPAVLWDKTILPGHAPAHLSAWDTSAHRHTSVGEQISSPATHHPEPPANHSWSKCTMCLLVSQCLPSLPGSCPCSVWIPAPRPAAGASAAPGQSSGYRQVGPLLTAVPLHKSNALHTGQCWWGIRLQWTDHFKAPYL